MSVAARSLARSLIRPRTWNNSLPHVSKRALRLHSISTDSDQYANQDTIDAGERGVPEETSHMVMEPGPVIRKYESQNPWYAKGSRSLEAGTSRTIRSAQDEMAKISPIVLRDMCACSLCVDASTRQKLFSTADIPSDISIKSLSVDDGHVRITWDSDITGCPLDHETRLPEASLQSLICGTSPVTVPELPLRTFWDAKKFSTDTSDIDYMSYMQDDATLLRAVKQLHTHGLLFLTDVPESPESVSHVAERIGPLKNTFYGRTWDVRSVPEAKNVAYTSQDLGFHMDLLYMEQPPHIQLLHCIRSSASGGASLFTDSYAAIDELIHGRHGLKLFEALVRYPVAYHYNHLDSGNFYEYSRPVIELKRLSIQLLRLHEVHPDDISACLRLPETLSAVSWSPPFQAPFRLHDLAPERVPGNARKVLRNNDPVEALSHRVRHWHPAAQSFNQAIHRYQGIYERMMKPGKCVLFDNRRVLHARKAFEVGDAGKERWLKGAYIDKDPYLSTLRSLLHRFESETSSSQRSKTLKEATQPPVE